MHRRKNSGRRLPELEREYDEHLSKLSENQRSHTDLFDATYDYTKQTKDDSPEKYLSDESENKNMIEKYQEAAQELTKLGISKLLQNSAGIKKYQEVPAQKQNSDFDSGGESLGSISSASEEDLKLLFNGKYHTMFEALDHIERITQEFMKESKKRPSRYNRLTDFLTC